MSANYHKVAIAQMCSGDDVASNIDVCRTLIRDAGSQDAKAIFFPEATDFIGKNFQQGLELTKTYESKFVEEMSRAAEDAAMWVGVGIHRKVPDIDKLFNSYLLITPSGKIEQTYDKVHLFDVDIPNGPRLKESEHTAPGERILDPVSTPFGNVGLAICYDIRFPELGQTLRAKGAELITFPSAFTVPTGRAHWEILNRCRAIETQCYVISPAQSGQHNDKRKSYGHSMIVNPWGEIVAHCDSETDTPMIAVADIDLEYLKSRRENMPVQTHRKPEIYYK